VRLRQEFVSATPVLQRGTGLEFKPGYATAGEVVPRTRTLA